MNRRGIIKILLIILPMILMLRVWGETRAPTAYLALTFDDSPNPVLTERLLDGLAERGAHATFFVIGEQIQGNEELIRRMEAEGHQVGNHTWTHRRLDTDCGLGSLELQRTEQALERVLGGSDYWVRPPWGFACQQTLDMAGVPLIHWSVDTMDWSVLNADQVADGIVQNAGDGDIVLLHDAYASSVDAALRAIDILRARGYAFVTLRELFDRMNVTAQKGCFYCRPDELRPVGN